MKKEHGTTNKYKKNLTNNNSQKTCYVRKQKWKFQKGISLSTDVPFAFQLRFWSFFKKMTQIVPNMGNHRAIWKGISLATSKGISVSTFGGSKSTQDVDN